MGRAKSSKNTKSSAGAPAQNPTPPDVLPRASVEALGQWLEGIDARLAALRELTASGRKRPDVARRAIATATEMLGELTVIAPRDAGPHAAKLAIVLAMLDRAQMGRL